jgi:lysophospholipase L1-like esterase
MKQRRIFFLGDSLIEFFDWRAQFQEEAVFNFGVAGETVEELLFRIEGLVNGYSPPDMIFIMSGINNVAMGDLEIDERYRQILRRLKRAYPEARIFAHGLLPTLLGWVSNESIDSVNGVLKKVAIEENAEFIDMTGLFTRGDGSVIADYLLDDGVHLSEPGYNVWADELEKVIRSS